MQKNEPTEFERKVSFVCTQVVDRILFYLMCIFVLYIMYNFFESNARLYATEKAFIEKYIYTYFNSNNTWRKSTQLNR